MRLRDLIKQFSERFAAAGIHCGHGVDNVYDEAVYLVFGALGLNFSTPVEQQDRPLLPEELERVRELARARMEQRIPTAYLLGKAWFAGHEFFCDSRALIPRSPIAELIGNGFEPFLDIDPGRVLDLCCGGGCIGIACALHFPGCKVELADISEDALDLARENIRLHGLEQCVTALHSNLFDGLEGQYDLILANPPYVSGEEIEQLPAEYRHEPSLGLFGAEDGIAIAGRLLEQSADRLSAEGWLILETGYSAGELESRFPGVPFLWLDFEHGGAGVCALQARQLRQLTAN